MTQEQMRAAVGAEIRAEASAQKISKTDLAKSAGISRQALYTYLDAERDMPIAVLFDLADRLGVTASELIERADQRTRRNAQQ